MAYYYSPRGFASPQPQSHWQPRRHQHHHQHEHAPYHYFSGGGYEAEHPTQSIDEEERLALAHLRAIQRRREAERANVERDAAIRLQVQQQREAAIARAVEAEKQRELALRREVERQHREYAIRIAIQQQRQREREEALAAIAEQRKAYKEQIIARRRAIHEQHQQQQQQRSCARQCEARRHARAANAGAKAQYPDNGDYSGVDAMNALFGSLFGVRFAPDAEDKTADKAEEKNQPAEQPASAPAPPQSTKTAEKAESTEQAFPESINDILSHFLGLRVDQVGDSSTATAADNKIPEGLNEFLSQFGLVFEPDQSADTPATSSQPEKAEPEAAPVNISDPPEAPLPAPVAAKSTPASASSSKVSAPSSSGTSHNETPLTAFLNGVADLPPFVRDILGNVELAFKEEFKKSGGGEKEQEVEPEVKGKGKGVAAGERSVNPVKSASAPSPSTTDSCETNKSVDSLSQLSSIAHDLHLVRESFTFPSTLSFAASPPEGSSSPAPAPALLFNKTNSGYHAQTHKLLQLLLAADGIQSAGDRDVRRKRKALVREVEGEIEALERRRDDVWEQVRVAREERGVIVDAEVPSDTESTGSRSTASRAASVVDASEDRTADLGVDETIDLGEKEVAHVEVKPAGDVGSEQEAAAADSEVKGFDITPADDQHKVAPKSFAEAAKKDVNVDVDEVKQPESGADKKEDRDVKEDGYELV